MPPHAAAPSASDDAVMRALLPIGRTGLSIFAGYVALLSVFLVPAPFALALGIGALLDLKHKPGKSGAGRAWFAIIAGGLGTLGLLSLWIGR